MLKVIPRAMLRPADGDVPAGGAPAAAPPPARSGSRNAGGMPAPRRAASEASETAPAKA